MIALETAINLARIFEGLRLKPYIDPAGIPTIGYGNTLYPDGRKVSLFDPSISRKYAEELLVREINKCLELTWKYCPVLLTSEKKLGAVADFVYNLGIGRLQTSTLRRRINEQNWDEAVKELKKWVWGGGRKLPGLIIRREAEARLIVK